MKAFIPRKLLSDSARADADRLKEIDLRINGIDNILSKLKNKRASKVKSLESANTMVANNRTFSGAELATRLVEERRRSLESWDSTEGKRLEALEAEAQTLRAERESLQKSLSQFCEIEISSMEVS